VCGDGMLGGTVGGVCLLRGRACGVVRRVSLRWLLAERHHGQAQEYSGEIFFDSVEQANGSWIVLNV